MSESGHLKDYPRRTFVDGLRGPQKEGAEDLLAGVAQAFQSANPRKLALALETGFDEPPIGQDGVFFLALICGVRFSIERRDVRPVLADLWTWLTSHPRHMPNELADLVVEALSPGLERAIRRHGGLRVGPEGPFEKIQGRPPDSRGAWVTAVLVDHWLRLRGIPATESVRRSVQLAEALLGREGVEASEFYANRDALGKPDPAPLLTELNAQYSYWLVHDGIRSDDPEPSDDNNEARISWSARHGKLPKLLGAWGSYGFALEVLSRIPAELWDPFSKRPGAASEPGEGEQ